MARRSPTNARYQKFQEPAGKTRKSAAAAKPSRKSADSSASSSKSKSKSSSSATRSKARMDPQTPEFKALRTRWWILLLSGVVLVSLSWGVRYLDKTGTWFGATVITLGQFKLSPAALLSSVTLGLAYAAIFYALYLDFAKMRPMRQAQSGGQSAKPAKPAKSEKPSKSTDTTDSAE